MKSKYIILLFALSSLTACGQQKNTDKKSKIIEKNITMDTSKLTNETVKKAFEALQAGDKIWYTFFTENPIMTDDGNKVDFKNFFAKALGTEKFLTIDKVENDGNDIYGNFKAGQWGTFPVFFKFHQNAEGKFDRLDIGQGK
ncbi:MAG: hypothetical protein EOO87_02665 [Pedobacter sp.]|nr:MAG: hypothetical protein EOO87_02665 [Pedobacter sp.]